MPVNQKWNIARAAGRGSSASHSPTTRSITFEYVLLAGVNDSDMDAARLPRSCVVFRAR